MRPIGCPETSVRDYHSAVRKIPKGRISQEFDVLEVLCILSTETGTLLQSAPETFPPPPFTGHTSLYSYKVLAWPRSFFVQNPVDARMRLCYTVTCSYLQTNSVALVRTRTIPTERLPPVGEVSANFCG